MPSNLPEDVLRIILSHLDINDIASIRQTCREFYELSKSRSVWDALFFRHVVDPDLPTPGLAGKSVKSLSAQELEKYFHASLGLHRNWTAPEPVVRRYQRLGERSQARLFGLHCLHRGDGGRYLVSLALEGHRRIFLRCWDVQPTTPVCVAQKEYSRVGSMAVNKSRSGEGAVAILTPHGVEILRLDPNATSPDEGFFTTRIVHDHLASVAYLHDSLLAARNSDGRIFLYDLTYPSAKVELLHNTQMPLDFAVTDTCVLILKKTTLELYPLPSSFEGIPRNVVISPIFAYEFPRQVDHGVMALRHGWPGATESNSAVTIFLRFGQALPWAVNVIEHFEIRPNPYFLSTETPSELNIPYQYPPVHVERIGSPVRMNALTHMAVGEFGTAVWIDTHTEDYYMHSHRGQRIAGSFAPLYRRRRRMQPLVQYQDEDDEDDEEESEVEEDPDQAEDEEDEEEEEGPMKMTMATSVYAHQDADSWMRLALDEQEGVIFVGRTDAVIEIFEYA